MTTKYKEETDDYDDDDDDEKTHIFNLKKLNEMQMSSLINRRDWQLNEKGKICVFGQCWWWAIRIYMSTQTPKNTDIHDNQSSSFILFCFFLPFFRSLNRRILFFLHWLSYEKWLLFLMCRFELLFASNDNKLKRWIQCESHIKIIYTWIWFTCTNWF